MEKNITVMMVKLKPCEELLFYVEHTWRWMTPRTAKETAMENFE